MYSGVIVLPPLHSSQSTWNRFSSERLSHPTQLCSSDIQVSSSLTLSTGHRTCTVYTSILSSSMQSSDMVPKWRCDQNKVVSGDSGDSRLAKTSDHIQPKSGSYASGRQQSVIGRKDDVIYDNVGLQTGRSCDMIQSETVVCGQDCGRKSATTTILNAPSSRGQYRRHGTTERGTQRILILNFKIPGGFPYLING